jgi:hypothetical protein
MKLFATIAKLLACPDITVSQQKRLMELPRLVNLDTDPRAGDDLIDRMEKMTIEDVEFVSALVSKHGAFLGGNTLRNGGMRPRGVLPEGRALVVKQDIPTQPSVERGGKTTYGG